MVGLDYLSLNFENSIVNYYHVPKVTRAYKKSYNGQPPKSYITRWYVLQEGIHGVSHRALIQTLLFSLDLFVCSSDVTLRYTQRGNDNNTVIEYRHLGESEGDNVYL